ncbi:MAG: hypothetical protein D6816_14420 [Bacteroidetes bacterium]|nr:MAG: hypothetical protein D6816_14420 [Bacteroidota bacterium]
MFIGAFFLSQEQRLKNDFYTFNETVLQRHFSMRLGFVGNREPSQPLSALFAPMPIPKTFGISARGAQ